MKYVIYAAVAALILWSVWYLVRRFGKKDCTGCDGDCDHCSKR